MNKRTNKKEMRRKTMNEKKKNKQKIYEQKNNKNEWRIKKIDLTKMYINEKQMKKWTNEQSGGYSNK